MLVSLAYGQGQLPVELPDVTQVIEPVHEPALPDPLGALRSAVARPIGSPPLIELLKPTDRVTVVHCDGTRPMPNDIVLEALGEVFDAVGIPDSQVTLLNALGTHRPNSPEELARILGPSALRRYRSLQSLSTDSESMRLIGTLRDGAEVRVHRAYVEADVRILLGFIEPHFFAGFSGGPKLVVPGIASQDTVQHVHSTTLIGSEQATWGVLDANPLWEALFEGACLAPPTFIINVALNRDKKITAVFAGALEAAHRAGVEHVREHSMRAVDEPFDVVVTTNSGYPLDQNFYQSVKGMSAAARIIRPGGSIVVVSECSDGIPAHGAFREIIEEGGTADGILSLVQSPGFRRTDQWQAQVYAMILQKARVLLYSEGISHQDARTLMVEPITNVASVVKQLMAAHASEYVRPIRVCALPEGPQTIPYLENI